MRVRQLLLVCLLVLGTVGGATGTAGAQQPDEGCRVISGVEQTARLACEQQTWFTCAGATKVQNASIVQGEIPSWGTIPPAQSVQQGAGCGTVETNLTSTSNPRNGNDGVWEGTFTGNLDRLTVEIHKIDYGLSRLEDSEPLLLWLQVDGADVIPRATETSIEVQGERSSTGASIKYEFSITDLGLVTEAGPGTQTRSIMLGIRSYADYPGVWVWDTTEVPAGITFNPLEVAAQSISR